MLRKLRKAFSLRPSDAVLALRAYSYLVQSGWMIFVRRQSTKKVQERIERARPSTHAYRTGTAFEYDRAALWVNRIARVPFPWARCYQRSVALSMWMKKQGLDPDLKFGARMTESGIDAHSWVEYDGRVINDSPNVRQVFGSFACATTPSELPSDRQAG